MSKQSFLDQNALVSNMSAASHCTNDVACEGFFGRLKRERVHHPNYCTRHEVRVDLFDCIERFHNPRMRRRVARRDRRFSAMFKPSAETRQNPGDLAHSRCQPQAAAYRLPEPP
jgi:putative transposase